MKDTSYSLIKYVLDSGDIDYYDIGVVNEFTKNRRITKIPTFWAQLLQQL